MKVSSIGGVRIIRKQHRRPVCQNDVNKTMTKQSDYMVISIVPMWMMWKTIPPVWPLGCGMALLLIVDQVTQLKTTLIYGLVTDCKFLCCLLMRFWIVFCGSDQQPNMQIGSVSAVQSRFTFINHHVSSQQLLMPETNIHLTSNYFVWVTGYFKLWSKLYIPQSHQLTDWLTNK